MRAKKIACISVTKRFGSFVALDDVNLEVMERETVALIGPSGSGKSTLLRCINHLEDVDSGVVLVEGQPMGYALKDGRLAKLSDEETSRQRTLVGMVFQNFNLFPHLTALQNVTEGPVHVLKRSKAEARDRAIALLERVGLGSKIGSYPHELSGGQQQRVAIARALAMEPSVILMDEPTSALDPELVGEVLEVIRQLASDGATLMIATHELGFAREIANRIVFMDHGRIVEVGMPAEVLQAPQKERTRAFLRHLLEAQAALPAP